MNILATIPETYADGPGIRYAIYIAGCTHKCDGCHNPESWDFDSGTPYTEMIEEIVKQIRSNPMLTGITFSGGDPMEHPIDMLAMLSILKAEFPDKDIWVYTGYLIEELIARGKETVECLELIGTLVDGKYDKTLKEDTNFRGSSNQRLINIKEFKHNSLFNNKTSL